MATIWKQYLEKLTGISALKQNGDVAKAIIVCLIPLLLLAATFDLYIERTAIGLGFALMGLSLIAALCIPCRYSIWLPQCLTGLYAFFAGFLLFIEGGAGHMAFLWISMLPLVFFSMFKPPYGSICSITFFLLVMSLYIIVPLPSQFSSIQVAMFTLSYIIQILIAMSINHCRMTREKTFEQHINIKQEKLLDSKHHIQEQERRIGEQAFHVQALNHVDSAIESSRKTVQDVPNVLKTILHIFNANRAWLLKISRSNSSITWSACYEVTSNNYHHAFSNKKNIPITPTMLDMALATSDAVTFPQMPNLALIKKHGIQSQMMIIIHDNEGSPWLLGIHQCSFPQDWDDYQQHLFKQISHRIADVIDGLSMSQTLEHQDHQYKELIKHMPDAICIIARQQLVYANKAFFKTLGIEHCYTMPEQELLKFVQADDHPLFLQHLNSTNPPAEHTTHSLQLQTFSGQLIHAQIQSQKILFHGSQAIQIIMKDISQQTKLDSALQHLLLKNKELTSKLIQRSEQKGIAIAQDLHDDSGQLLTALSSTLASLKPLKNAKERQQRIEDAEQIVQSLFSSIRSTLETLQPTLIDTMGLEYAIHNNASQWEQRFQIKVEMKISKFTSTPSPEVSTAIFRIIQEALTNIAKHANAKHVWISLHQTTEQPASLVLSIKDDGCGFDTAQEEYKGFGLFGMLARVDLAAGTFNVKSHVGLGTTVHANFPIY